VAETVVDRLELVDVEHDHRQRPAVARGTRQRPAEELEQVALLCVSVRASMMVRRRFLVVLGLDVAARQER